MLVSTPGVCNLLSDADTVRFAEMIRISLDGLINVNNETQNKTINEILGSIKKCDMSALHETQSAVKNLKQKQIKGNINEEDTSLLEDYKNYLTHLGNSFNFNIFESGQYMADKVYSRDNLEEGDNYWVIKVIGSSKPELQGMDLMTHLNLPTEESDETSESDKTSILTLQEIVDFLEKNNVKTIIIFDLSCSVLYTPDFKTLSKRAESRLRRGMILPTKGREVPNKLIMGGKTKKKKMVRKNKKNTKRRKTRKTRKKIAFFKYFNLYI